MSDLSEIPIEQKEMLNKLNKLNKTLKEYSNKLDENKNKLAKLMEQPMKKNDDAEREKMDKIFEKKQIGRPAGSFETKQKQYLSMLNENKIKQPKEQTLEYYRIARDGDKYKLMD
jgi:septal ring factor EnvC (AmiA/AmiB activator)